MIYIYICLSNSVKPEVYTHSQEHKAQIYLRMKKKNRITFISKIILIPNSRVAFDTAIIIHSISPL